MSHLFEACCRIINCEASNVDAEKLLEVLCAVSRKRTNIDRLKAIGFEPFNSEERYNVGAHNPASHMLYEYIVGHRKRSNDRAPLSDLLDLAAAHKCEMVRDKVLESAIFTTCENYVRDKIRRSSREILSEDPEGDFSSPDQVINTQSTISDDIEKLAEDLIEALGMS